MESIGADFEMMIDEDGETESRPSSTSVMIGRQSLGQLTAEQKEELRKYEHE